MKVADSSRLVTCPSCGKQFPLTDGIIGPLRSELRDSFEQEYNKKLSNAMESLQKKADELTEKRHAEELGELNGEVAELNKKLDTAKNNELELRKQRRELEAKQKDLELEITRKVDEQTAKIKEDVQNSYSLKIRQQDEQMVAMRKQIEELKRKAEQGSQQSQGEALEVELEEILKASFKDDTIEPIQKGVRGADIKQIVKNKTGHSCGIILWEFKNTKNWNASWIRKLKDDQRDRKAEIAVIASVVLPNDVSNFAMKDGVWITHWTFACQLACALRLNLIELDLLKTSNEGKEQKMEMLYAYLTSEQFRQRVEMIVESFTKMRDDLIQEKQAMEKIWSKREKNIETVMKGTVRMYGDLEGIIGAAIKEIPALNMPNQLEAGR